jgi:hypothetical protein
MITSLRSRGLSGTAQSRRRRDNAHGPRGSSRGHQVVRDWVARTGITLDGEPCSPVHLRDGRPSEPRPPIHLHERPSGKRSPPVHERERRPGERRSCPGELGRLARERSSSTYLAGTTERPFAARTLILNVVVRQTPRSACTSLGDVPASDARARASERDAPPASDARARASLGEPRERSSFTYLAGRRAGEPGWCPGERGRRSGERGSCPGEPETLAPERSSFTYLAGRRPGERRWCPDESGRLARVRSSFTYRARRLARERSSCPGERGSCSSRRHERRMARFRPARALCELPQRRWPPRVVTVSSRPVQLRTRAGPPSAGSTQHFPRWADRES